MKKDDDAFTRAQDSLDRARKSSNLLFADKQLRIAMVEALIDIAESLREITNKGIPENRC